MDKGRFGRQDRLMRERRHDSYREKQKLRDGTACGDCSAVYEGGRWTWERPDKKMMITTCPACLRTADKYPAGTVSIKGAFFVEHRGEIMNLVRNIEKVEKNERPLERIMTIETKGNQSEISTTGIHIARRIGDALRSSYSGTLNYHYEEDENRIRVRWERE